MIYKIPYGRQNISEEDVEAVLETMGSDFLTTGPKVQEFEEKFAQYIGVKYAVAVSNGTAALHLSALALGVNEESKVITTPVTFAATANCVRYCGGEVFFADIDPETLTLDTSKVEELINSKPEGFFDGIIPVDFTGYPVDLERFRELADKYKLWIIEDACHAPGGYFLDSLDERQNCGNGKFAELAIFSFHPVKHIACGEGGMVTTNDRELYEKIKRLRSHGMVYQGNPNLVDNHGGWYMELQELGFNYRIPDILCSLGISQLKRADKGLERRRIIARKYDSAFSQKGIVIPASVEGHAYHLYVVRVKCRKKLYDELKENGIYCQIHYIPLHLMPYYRNLGYSFGDFPIAEKYYDECISLPMYPSLTDDEQNFVIEKVTELTSK